MQLCRPRQWGACWLTGQVWSELQLDRFWADRLPANRKGTRWDHVLRVLGNNRCLACRRATLPVLKSPPMMIGTSRRTGFGASGRPAPDGDRDRRRRPCTVLNRVVAMVVQVPVAVAGRLWRDCGPGGEGRSVVPPARGGGGGCEPRARPEAGDLELAVGRSGAPAARWRPRVSLPERTPTSPAASSQAPSNVFHCRTRR
jgi:hypothetical protein